MRKHLASLFFTYILGMAIGHAQVMLPLTGSQIETIPMGAIKIEFTGTQQGFLLSSPLNWNDYDSYTLYFSEPTSATGIRIGKDLIPKGVRTFQGFSPDSKYISWEASNGQRFEKNLAWIKVTSESPTVLHIREVILNGKDGSKTRCNYSLSPFINIPVHFEANNGEEFDEFIEESWEKPYKIVLFSGKTTFKESDSYIGGTEWVKAGNSLTYHLKLYNPVGSDNFTWKYTTKGGKTYHQEIERNSNISSLTVNEEISECYITHKGNGNDFLEIQEISITESTQTNSDILVLWHRNGMTTDILLNAKPRITFSKDKLNVQGTDISLEFLIDDIIKFTYEKENALSVNDIPKEKTSFVREGERITFNGVKSLDQVSLYNMNGIRIPIQPYHTATGNVSLSLYSIPTGIYLIKVNSITYKIVKR